MTTKHTHEPNFGRRVAGCPRCDELNNGAAPITWAPSRAQLDAKRSAEIHAHFNSHYHRAGLCGVQCTFGDW